MTFKMNKKRNVGLVHEFLVRRLGSQLVDQDAEGATRTIEITQRHFSPGKPLTEELQFFRIIQETRDISETSARRILGEVCRAAAKTNTKLLEGYKSALIRELNRAFGKSFFNQHRLPNYRLLGAIQIYIDGRRSGRLAEGVEALHLEDGLVRWMTSKPVVETRDVDTQVDDLVCTMAHRRFSEKYGETLSGPQKTLLQAYVRSMVMENPASLTGKLEEDRKTIARILIENFKLKEVQQDPVMKERYIEASRRLGSMDFRRPDEKTVEEMVLFHRLSEELASNE